MVNVGKCYWILILFLLTMADNIYSKEESSNIFQITTVMPRTSEGYEEMLTAMDVNPRQDVEATVEYEDKSMYGGTTQRQESEVTSDYVGRPNDKETEIGEVTYHRSKHKIVIHTKEKDVKGTVSEKMKLGNAESKQTTDNLKQTEGYKVTQVASDNVTVTEKYTVTEKTSNNVTESEYYDDEIDLNATLGNRPTEMNAPVKNESALTENETELPKEESNSKDGSEFKQTNTALLTEIPQYAKLSQFPWIVVFRASPLNRYKQGDTLCTGTLIEDMWVLTVAHCFHPNDNTSAYKVFAGIIEVPAADKEEITKFYQERIVSDIIVHPRFSYKDLREFQELKNDANGIVNKEATNYLHDLALMRLQTPFSDNTQVIIRPLRMSPPIIEMEQEHCVIVAWDRFQEQDDKEVKKDSEVRLQWKRVWLDAGKVCERRYNQTLVNIMCLGSDDGKKTCYGPGGSPLVCRVANKDRMVKLLGISLWIKIAVGCSDIFPQYLWVEGYENWMARVMRSPYRSMAPFRRLSVKRRLYYNAGLRLCVDKALVLAALAACALYSISWTEILGTNRSHIPQASWSHHDCFLDVT